MHITRYTDYALRTLMYVALKGDSLSTAGEIAERYNISRHHLVKVVQALNNKGYVNTVRGKHGGIRLGMLPDAINIGQLVRDTEQDLTLVECFNTNGSCVLTPACQLKQVFAEALEAFFKTLDQYTLTDLLPPGKANHMVRLLRITSL